MAEPTNFINGGAGQDWIEGAMEQTGLWRRQQRHDQGEAGGDVIAGDSADITSDPPLNSNGTQSPVR